MKYWFLVFVIGLMLLLGSSPGLYAQAPAQKPAEQTQEPPPVLSVPKDYRYNPRGRRDPFVNPVPPPKQEEGPARPQAPPERPAGLRGVMVNEATIAGIVIGKDDPTMTVVTIIAPGGRRYFARVGDALYDGVIKEITMNAVRFTETAPGGGPVPSPREFVRMFGRAPGENK